VSETCQACRKSYETVYRVPADVWEKIKPGGKPAGAGLLCPLCADIRAREAGIDLFWEARLTPSLDEVQEEYTNDGPNQISDRLHECFVCGKIGIWGTSWSWKYFIVGDRRNLGETVIKVCSSECRSRTHWEGAKRFWFDGDRMTEKTVMERIRRFELNVKEMTK